MWSHLQVQGREAAQKSKQSLGSVQFRQRSERETKVSRWHRFTRQLSRTSPASSSWVNVGWSLSSPPPLCMNVAPVQHLTDISLHQAALLVHRTKGRKGQNAHMYRWARALMKAQSSFEMLVQTHISWFKSDVLELFQYELIHFRLGASGRLPFPIRLFDLCKKRLLEYGYISSSSSGTCLNILFGFEKLPNDWGEPAATIAAAWLNQYWGKVLVVQLPSVNGNTQS